jgi:hypothetical protein
MGTLNAVYVGCNAPDEVALVRSHFSDAEYLLNESFCAVFLPGHEQTPPEDKLVNLSSMLRTEVFWYSFQTGVGVVEYHHWTAGTKVRSLVFG